MARLVQIFKLLFPARKTGRDQDKPGRQPGGDADEPLRIPRHLAVFMDGNGRWARQRGLPRTAGHRAGAENLQNLCRMCGRHGIQYLTVYAFSTENWNRPQEEVQALMELFVEFFERYDRELAKEGIRVRFSGDRNGLPQSVTDIMERAEADSASRQKMQLIIALNYGGRREIVQACRKLACEVADGRLAPDAIDEQALSAALYLPDVPDPDLVIRPSGEQRLSNFLLWQSAYAEFWYANVLWPDFNETHLTEALKEFTRRDRRYGGITK
ncbi:MAG: isoprenyl transferase [Bacillota bacterium]|nr:isoprenyl transferase [Bacillota bacterium]